MDEYSQGWSGYSFEDHTLLSLQQESRNEWHTPSPKKTFRQPSSCGVGCSHTVNGGRYAALSGSQESCDFDLPMMMMEYSDSVPGDAPTGNAEKKESVVPVLVSQSSIVPDTLHQRPLTGLFGEETEEGARSTQLLPASSSGNTDNSQDFQVLEEHTSPTPEGGDAPRRRSFKTSTRASRSASGARGTRVQCFSRAAQGTKEQCSATRRFPWRTRSS